MNTMALKFVTTICVILVIIECLSWTDASQYPYENQFIHVRQKRGSPDFFGKIKSSITGSITKASASSAGASSGTSSSKTFIHHEKPTVIVEKEVPFDGWELKKSILNTIFQAVKAITGGVTAIKGQLIKGSGYALSHGGKLIAAGGDAVTSVGKKIALSAKLLPPEKPAYTKYFASSGHGSSGHGTSHDDFTSYGHDELVEFAQPHDFTGYGGPEPPLPQYLPVDVAYDNHYEVSHPHVHIHQPHASYGPPPPLNPYSHLTNYINTDRKEQEQHYENKPNAIRIPGLETDHEQATHDVNQKAVEALQQILRKLPHKDNLIQTSIDDDNFIPDTKLPPTQITQFPIPKDPNLYIPKFKPIKSSVISTYTFQLGPIETITRDSYGAHSHINSIGVHKPDATIKKTITGSIQLPTNLVPPSKDTIHNTKFKFQISKPKPLQTSSQQGHSHTINTQPLDLYHTMTLKNQPNSSTQNVQYLSQSSSAQTPQSHIQPPPPPSQPLPEYEIQKSVEYQLH